MASQYAASINSRVDSLVTTATEQMNAEIQELKSFKINAEFYKDEVKKLNGILDFMHGFKSKNAYEEMMYFMHGIKQITLNEQSKLKKSPFWNRTMSCPDCYPKCCWPPILNGPSLEVAKTTMQGLFFSSLSIRNKLIIEQDVRTKLEAKNVNKMSYMTSLNKEKCTQTDANPMDEKIAEKHKTQEQIIKKLSNEMSMSHKQLQEQEKLIMFQTSQLTNKKSFIVKLEGKLAERNRRNSDINILLQKTRSEKQISEKDSEKQITKLNIIIAECQRAIIQLTISMKKETDLINDLQCKISKIQAENEVIINDNIELERDKNEIIEDNSCQVCFEPVSLVPRTITVLESNFIGVTFLHQFVSKFQFFSVSGPEIGHFFSILCQRAIFLFFFIVGLKMSVGFIRNEI